MKMLTEKQGYYLQNSLFTIGILIYGYGYVNNRDVMMLGMIMLTLSAGMVIQKYFVNTEVK